MILSTKPRIIISNERKIHVSRKPGFLAWLLLSLSAIIFIAISHRLMKNIIYFIILILGEIMFALDAFGEWQDLLLDKNENKAVITKYTWIDKLCFQILHNSCIVMKLNDIRHVGVSMELGLFLLHRSGKTTSLSLQGFSRQELQQLKREITNFLNMNEIESLDMSAANSIKLSFVTPRLENLCNVQRTQLPMSSLNQIKLTPDKSGKCKRQHSIHHNFSLPTLGTRKETKKRRQFCLRKAINTENSTCGCQVKCA